MSSAACFLFFDGCGVGYNPETELLASTKTVYVVGSKYYRHVCNIQAHLLAIFSYVLYPSLELSYATTF